MKGFKVGTKVLKILDFDSECRPLAWYGGDFVTKQPTAIAWKIVGTKAAPKVAFIGESLNADLIHEEEKTMLEAFRMAYNSADVVTGHYIRGFDLPLLNGALIRNGLEPLEKKLSQDTKQDFARRHGMSLSQENLGAMFELEHPKYPMNTALWAEANMLTTKGIKLTRKRVVADVEQHIELRQKMLDANLLRAPQLWTPDSPGGYGNYHG